jgi:leucyl-tRNA synthetase
MRSQLDRLGYSFDWARTFVTSEPEMYKWSQWLFLALLEEGLVYRREGQVHWCQGCRTTLAATQVEDERCWRCHNVASLAYRSQWYLRLSAYNDENYRRIAELTDWNAPALAAQLALLGRVEGVEFDAYALDGKVLTVFTPYAEDIAHTAFVAMSPNHPDLAQWAGHINIEVAMADIELTVRRTSESARDATVLIDTGTLVQIPGCDAPLPLVISGYVDARFGPTTVAGIPSRDSTDMTLAQRIGTHGGIAWRLATRERGTRDAVRYRAMDFPLSRQRAWGAPIPIIYCEACGVVPVPVDRLPVELPGDLILEPAGNVLESRRDFIDSECPTCGRPARRETDTLDCHMDVTWIEIPLAVPTESRKDNMFSHADLAKWLPVAKFVHGADTGGFVLTERMVAKALRDRGVLDFLRGGEPYGPTVMHEMVRLSGEKMSKHLGNVVSPGALVERFGADAVRFAILYAAGPARSFNWNEEVVRYCAAFLERLWTFAEPRLRGVSADKTALAFEQGDYLRRKLATWSATAVVRITKNLEALEMQRATRNAIFFLGRIEDFETRVLARRHTADAQDTEAIVVALRLLSQLLAPMTPHIAEELWQRAAGQGLLHETPWPTGTSAVVAK